MKWDIWSLKLLKEFGVTLYMVGVSTAITILLGLPPGIRLNLTSPKGLSPKPTLYKTLSIRINIGRSLPFIILLVAILPLTRFIWAQPLEPPPPSHHLPWRPYPSLPGWLRPL